MGCFNQKIVGRAFEYLQLDEAQLRYQIRFFYRDQLTGLHKIIRFLHSGNTGRLRQRGNIPILSGSIQFVYQGRIGSQAETKPHSRYGKYFRKGFQNNQIRITGQLVDQCIILPVLHKIEKTFIYQ